MLKKKNAQGLSIRIVVVAVIGLIILTIVIMLMTGKFNSFSEGVKSVGNPAKTCEAQEGYLTDNPCAGSQVSILARDAGGSGKNCCKGRGTCVEACTQIGKKKSSGVYDQNGCLNDVHSSMNPQSLGRGYKGIPNGKVCCCVKQ